MGNLFISVSRCNKVFGRRRWQRALSALVHAQPSALSDSAHSGAEYSGDYFNSRRNRQASTRRFDLEWQPSGGAVSAWRFGRTLFESDAFYLQRSPPRPLLISARLQLQPGPLAGIAIQANP